MSYATRPNPKFLNPPALWTLRAASWVAFVTAGYLAWTAIGHVPIAGCAGSGLFDCDAVHNSQWSMWFSLPVALGGLACYAILAGLCLVAGLEAGAVSRWIRTLLIMFAAVAAGAAIWFIFLQIAVIGNICPVCMAIHCCGLLIAGVVLGAIVRQPAAAGPPRIPAAGLAALRATMPVANKAMPRAPQADDLPSLAMALGGAAALLALLIGGQTLFPATTYTVEAVDLDEPFDMGGATDRPFTAHASSETPSEAHVAMRPSVQDREPRLAGDSDRASAISPPSETSTSGYAGESALDPTVARGGNDQLDPETSEPAGTRSGETLSPSDVITEEPPSRERTIKLLGGKLTLDVYKQPVLGSPDAPHVLVELVSYDCPHCRKAHALVEKGRQRYVGQLAVVVLPVPLDRKCNRLVTSDNPDHKGSCALARHALAVAAVNPEAFEEYHDWLMTGEKAPSVEKAMAKAYELVGRERAMRAAYSDDLKNQISENVELFATLQKRHSANRNFGLPVQIMRNGVMSGSANEPEDVYRTWEEHLGLEPPPDST